jgi:hypothetical protein
MTVAPLKGPDRQAALTAALTGRDADRGGPGQPDYLADPSGPGWRSPVIAAAILVVLLGMAGGTYLAFRGHGTPSGHPSGAAAPSAPHHAGGTAGAGGGTAGPPGAHHTSHPSTGASAAASASPGASASARPSASGRPSPRSAARPASPAATVRAYITAINHHHYRRAWHLRGRAGVTTYAAFTQGFSTTSKDALFILGVSGDVVSVRLDAQQTDGSIKTYQGTYTVQDGVITAANIRQIS